MNAVKLSVVIITYNEERNILNCLKSVQSIADEIVVVDSYSSDKTAEIAKQFGAKVILHKFEGHIQQKNYAITLAANPYILSIDADEMPDTTLLEQIKLVKQNRIYDGYSANRLNNYCGQWIKHGAWFPDIKLRLWNSSKGEWKGLNPHDKFEMSSTSKIKHLPGNLLHYSYQNKDQHLKKTDYFSSISANAYNSNGKKSSQLKIIFSPIFRFTRDYFFKLGFLDGINGFKIATISAFEVYLKYKKLYQLQTQTK